MRFTIVVGICVALFVGTAAAQPADRLKPAPGQPLCIDQDSLLTPLMSGVLAAARGDKSMDTQNGCQTIPIGSRVDVLERYASGAEIMRIVKVRVSSPKLRGPTIGYTVEIDN